MKCVGLDIFFVSTSFPNIPPKIADCELVQISNRGSKVWPGPVPNIQMTDLYTARYKKLDGNALDPNEALQIISEFSKTQNWVHIEKLLQFNNVDRFA